MRSHAAGAAALWLLPSLALAWREWPHVGEGTPKWKRNWMPRTQQNDTYFRGELTTQLASA